MQRLCTVLGRRQKRPRIDRGFVFARGFATRLGNTNTDGVWLFTSELDEVNARALAWDKALTSKPASDIPHRRVTIMGGVHGNERLGINVVNRLVKLLRSERYGIKRPNSEIVLILGNLPAIEQNIRFCQADLNRCFRSELLDPAYTPKSGAYEEQRAFELAPLLFGSEILVDLHATNMPSEPFARVGYAEMSTAHARILSWYRLNLAKRFKVLLDPKLNIGNGVVSTTDEFVNASGGVGVCIETGHASDTSMEDLVLGRTLEMLEVNVGLFERNQSERKRVWRFSLADLLGEAETKGAGEKTEDLYVNLKQLESKESYGQFCMPMVPSQLANPSEVEKAMKRARISASRTKEQTNVDFDKNVWVEQRFNEILAETMQNTIEVHELDRSTMIFDSMYEHQFEFFKLREPFVLKHSSFEWDGNLKVRNWQPLEMGTTIGSFHDDNGKISYVTNDHRNAFLLFPKVPELLNVGKPAFWIAESVRDVEEMVEEEMEGSDNEERKPVETSFVPRRRPKFEFLRPEPGETHLMDGFHFKFRTLSQRQNQNLDVEFERMHGEIRSFRLSSNEPYKIIVAVDQEHVSQGIGVIAPKKVKRLQTVDPRRPAFLFSRVVDDVKKKFKEGSQRRAFPVGTNLPGEHFVIASPDDSYSSSISIWFPLYVAVKDDMTYIGMKLQGEKKTAISERLNELGLPFEITKGRIYFPWFNRKEVFVHQTETTTAEGVYSHEYGVFVTGKSEAQVEDAYVQLEEIIINYVELFQRHTPEYPFRIDPMFDERGVLATRFGSATPIHVNRARHKDLPFEDDDL